MAVRPDATTKNAAPLSASAEEDLEQYGVWVKAEPQDIIEEPEIVSLDDSDFGLPAAEPLSGSDSLLSGEEEKLLGSFEKLDAASISADESLETFDSESSASPDMESLPPLEDFDIHEGDSSIEELGAATIDISLDELEAPSPLGLDSPLDMDSIRGLDESRGTVEFAPSAASAGKAGVLEDVSAEFLDFSEPSSSQGLGGKDVTADFLDDTQPAEAPLASEPDFEPIDMDLHFDDTLHADDGASSEPGFESVSEFDDFLREDEKAPAAPKAKARSSVPFDDLSAVERELSEPSSAPPQSYGGPSQAGGGNSALANDLLERIAAELSSIRSELVNLKGQIVTLKAEESSAQGAETDEAQSKTAGGFFDEEEDETIALTGDELDNILNTADFTEETPGEEPGLDVDLGSVSLDDESILPESGDYQTAASLPGIEEINLEPSAEPVEELLAEDLGDMDLMSEEGVQPLTKAPEDTSYLEIPLEEEESIDLSEIPLHEESLAEEPLPEMVEELSMVEEEILPAEEVLPDMTFGLDAGEGYMPELVEEAKPVETLPEIEDIDFGDISLAEESSAPSMDDAEEAEELEEVEELAVMEDDLSPEMTQAIEEEDLAARLDAATIKPAEPVSFHPDEIPMGLDDSFFVGESEPKPAPAPAARKKTAEPEAPAPAADDDRLKNEIRGVLSYLDKLLESLPDSKIDEFAHSEYFDTYKKLFEELGLV